LVNPPHPPWEECPCGGRGEVSDGDALDLVERDLIAGAIVKLRCAWRLVRGDLLGVFEGAAIPANASAVKKGRGGEMWGAPVERLIVDR